ncbi:MAG: hypothetical protein ACKPKO_60845, partial [Candidatus Fonsibacter sp.]
MLFDRSPSAAVSPCVFIVCEDDGSEQSIASDYAYLGFDGTNLVAAVDSDDGDMYKWGVIDVTSRSV